MDCPLCFESLDSGPATRYNHPRNGTCTGFDIHVSCLAIYIHNHLTQDTNLFCTTCILDLKHELTPLQEAERRVRQAERRVQRLRERLEEAERIEAEQVFHQIPGYADLFHIVLGGHSLIQIVVTGGAFHHYLPLGVCTIYAFIRVEPYLRRVRAGGTRKGGRKRSLRPNELAIIQVPYSDETLFKLESELGARLIHLNRSL